MNPPKRPSSLTLPEGYADWLAQLKSQIVQARHEFIAVNGLHLHV